MKLTQRRIEDLTCEPGRKDQLFADDEQQGLYVRVGKRASKGSLEFKSFLAMYRHAGKKPKLPLGSCSAISLASARVAVRSILGEVAKGKNPAAERKEAARNARQKAAEDALTLDVLITLWKERHLASRRTAYSDEAPRGLRYAFRKYLNASAASLTTKAVKAVLHGIADDGKKTMSRLTCAYGRACYGWAIGKDLLSENPFAGIKLDAAASRDRVLSDEELAAIWKSTSAPGPYNGIVRLLMLSGQRRDEVGGMTWSELSDDISVWTIPASRTKNGVSHILPVSPQMQSILRATPRIEGEALVFPGLRGAFAGFSKAKAALDKACGVRDWRIHDLRRSCATGLQRLGVRLEVTESVLNHTSGSRAGIVGIYQRHNWAAEKRAALDAWGAHVEAVVEGRKPANKNVVAFTRPA